MRKNKIIILSLLLSSFSITTQSHCLNQEKMYFCTASDSDFFEYLLQLIGSVHRVNFKETEEISVFDLGLTKTQRAFLNSINKVTVYDVEMTNPDLLKDFEL